MPVLARLQAQYKDRIAVLAVNIDAQNSPLGDWVDFMRTYAPEGMAGATGAMAVQDVNEQAVPRYRIASLGTEVLVDAQGRIAFRSESPSGIRTLQAEIDKVL